MTRTEPMWDRYRTFLCESPSTGIRVDVSRMRFPADLFDQLRPRLQAAFSAMEALERGAISNPDEGRMVGHYWLRAPDLAPNDEVKRAIEETRGAIVAFAHEVHSGRVAPEKAPRFRNLLVIGIGGSALGPELVSAALGGRADAMRAFFLDNTDPDGFDLVFDQIGDGLVETITVVISKSGGTKETRNGMLEAEQRYRSRGLDFGKHAVAVTGEGSELDKVARTGDWLRRFPMWDWVGGRTSELSAVGLVPAALQGIDVEELLEGARCMDADTRREDVLQNPAALLAAMWHFGTGGTGSKDMVVLPYKDRLLLLSRYLQQLVMESLGKELDLQGNRVNQGLTVYGNKGSTDQHAYVQQLREGVANFFVLFVEVLRDRQGASVEVEPGITAGDYLSGFYLGTRRALYENGRDSITVTLPDVSARTLGALIALFERAVGYYASMVGVNAYHQPGVEAGKRAAAEILVLQGKVLATLQGTGGPVSAAEIASLAHADNEVETVHKILEHLASNPERGVAREGSGCDATYLWRAAR